MLRPEQMSKVSVTGAKSVMDDVIETMHELHIVHITDYDGSWEGFEPGAPLTGSDEASSKLVTVRAIMSTLDITREDAGSTAAVDLEDADERLESIRTEVNELDDRRDELRSRRREIDDRLEQMEVFADLGLDLELLHGYDSLEVLVGEGNAEAIQETLEDADELDEFDVFTGTDTVAIFGYVQDDGEGVLEDALVGVQFTEYEVPEESGDPQVVVEELEHERQQLQTELEKVESELESLKLDSAAFLLALEEKLTIDAQKYEAPLRFATTERSFIVEGWVPTESIEEFEAELRDAVGDRIEVDEIERAQYTSGGHVHRETHEEEHGESAEATADGGARAATDGGSTASATAASGATADSETTATDGGRDIVTVEDTPPVIQKNSKIVSPFEVLVKAVNRPKYWELDPTMLVFLTFPFFFGFMIGDVGYGILYVIIGYYLEKNFDSQGIRDFGMVVVWLGIWTIIFGVLYGELFGHYVFEWLWAPILGAGEYQLLDKGIVSTDWAVTWLIVACLFGWIQINIAYVFDFIEEFQIHGIKPAMIEAGSWILMLNGLWVWIFSEHLAADAGGPKPEFLVGEGAIIQETLNVPFTGFPELVGILGLVAFALGILLLLTGPWYEVFEFLVPVVHVLSYTRLTAVLLSKAGMAVAANLLYFGAVMGDGSFDFLIGTAPGDVPDDAIFQGLSNMGNVHLELLGFQFGLEGALLGIPVLIAGHLIVLAIGGTAALQAIRLEYVEFFEKFYEGGGKNYEPFGYERNYTTDN